ncbi:PP2C family protein-serine/threonine phosphatase [Sediminispirochaeta bajacaliforniensis]|uniref:PP2C family protein-serine/threonine phosphatase n=1 Tax=Sediminispirochaeta bajacaliforniensis TaxID=148 RepID=UPI0003825B09|nr:SpoIIE family protein phosphatase [Sediminispirochaeta bajacaliforniensis]
MEETLPKTILIVDDEPQVLRSLKWELEIVPLDEPLHVVTYDTTRAALEFLEESSREVFLLIADLRMPAPNLSGSDLLLKVHERYPEIILIMLTAYSDIPEIQKAITADIQALLFKPWTAGMLLAEIIKARRVFRMRHENRELQERLRRQLEYAGEFQRNIMLSPKLSDPNLTIELRYEPNGAYTCGGDYYDAVKIASDQLLFFFGDVSGHGIRPAFITAMIKVILTELVFEKRMTVPKELLEELNRRLCMALERVHDFFVTFKIFLIESDKHLLTLANAGHLPLFLLRGGQCTTFQSEGAALGFKRDMEFDQLSMELMPEDLLILFTDGLIERPQTEKRMSNEAVCKLIRPLGGELSGIADAVFDRLSADRSRDARIEDDITVAALRYRPAATAGR